MTLGRKIQHLRKEKNLSQELLAEQLAVSRQAISKWELGASTPETDKIIHLSKIFMVSTDYLLHDDVNSDQDIPAVQTNSERLKEQYGIKTLFTVTIGVSIIGLFMSIVAQFTWQTLFSVSIGLMIQIIGVITFEAMNSQYITENGKKIVRKGFYALNVWLILPFPVIYLSNLIFDFYPWSYGYGIYLLFTAIMYVIFCGIITFVLVRKPKYS